MDYADLKTKYDSSNMHDDIRAWLTSFKAAFDQGYTAPLPDAAKSATQVVGIGMGGSGMGYKLLQGLARHVGTKPITIVSDYDLPAYLGASSALFATSHSGGTEETLSVVNQVMQKNMAVTCVTTGGALAQLAQSHHLPLITYNYAKQPRVALPYTFGIGLGLFVQAGYLNISQSEIDAAIAEVQPSIDQWTMAHSSNEAMNLAEQLHQKLVFVVGAGLSEAVAVRWKGQMNENAKTIAFAEAMPEMCHNMLLGYQHPDAVRTQSAVVFLQSKHDHPQNRKRVQVVGGMISETGASVIPVESPDLSYVGTMLYQIIFGDFVSYYLALLNGVDPVDTARIESLKKQLV